MTFLCDTNIIGNRDLHSAGVLRNRQHQPIVVINVQQRLQYSSPSSQRSVSVSTTEEAEA